MAFQHWLTGMISIHTLPYLLEESETMLVCPEYHLQCQFLNKKKKKGESFHEH